MSISRISTLPYAKTPQAWTAIVPMTVEMMVARTWSTFFTVDHLIFFIRFTVFKSYTKMRGGSDRADLMAVFWMLSQLLILNSQFLIASVAMAMPRLHLRSLWISPTKVRYGERRFVARSSQKWPEVTIKTQI
jgi:hypothetical protein